MDDRQQFSGVQQFPLLPVHRAHHAILFRPYLLEGDRLFQRRLLTFQFQLFRQLPQDRLLSKGRHGFLHRMAACAQAFQRRFLLTGIQGEQKLTLPDVFTFLRADSSQHAPLQTDGGLLLPVLYHALRKGRFRPFSPADNSGLHRDFRRIGQKKKRRHRCQSHGDNAQGCLGSGHAFPSRRQIG